MTAVATGDTAVAIAQTANLGTSAVARGSNSTSVTLSAQMLKGLTIDNVNVLGSDIGLTTMP